MSRKFDNMQERKKEPKITQVRRQKRIVEKGVDTKKYCGVLRLKEEPMTIQKKLRDEWR